MSEHPFWAFSLEVYGRAEVRELLLELQDGFAWDVNMALLCCWVATCGEQLDEPRLERIAAATDAWRSGVVRPLRAARRAMGAKPPLDLRRRALALELDCEKVAQLAIAAAYASLTPEPVQSGLAEVMRANLLAYRGVERRRSGLLPPEERIDQLVCQIQ